MDGDSQAKHLYQHFDPNRPGTPAFITQPGACIGDVQSLLDFVPETGKTISLHVGTNDLATVSGSTAFGRYKALLNLIGKECPKVSRVYATLVLPRSTNRRLRIRNYRFVGRCNREASFFNRVLRNYCRRSRTVFYLHHELQFYPAAKVLAADGLHPRFEGVAVMPATSMACASVGGARLQPGLRPGRPTSPLRCHPSIPQITAAELRCRGRCPCGAFDCSFFELAVQPPLEHLKVPAPRLPELTAPY
ncbi:hypothetical protein HPB48_026179 [Haemaphysalis longicornis]|uniref:Uncharacterized protein n=1 Tax=Haemaphysalis longicornis TaxID=44386 RepID=A0A9J6HAS8_HAELO|nr:hypothetical protein HPB48_026179 [Haemaphysalis longicornis]